MRKSGRIEKIQIDAEKQKDWEKADRCGKADGLRKFRKEGMESESREKRH